METKNTTIGALITLLDDPDKEVFGVVYNNLINRGVEIIPELEKAWELCPSQFVQERLESIIQKIHLDSIKSEIKKWGKLIEPDVVEGAFWIAKYQFPELNYTEIIKDIDKIAQEVWLEINRNLTAYEKINIINQVLFKNYKFKNIVNLVNPQNFYINRVIEMKKGSPVCLAIIYLGITKRLQLPVFGVDLPNSFILAYMDDFHGFESPSEEQKVLFYINPANSGVVFGKSEIESYLKTMKIENSDEYFFPCKPKQVIKRLIDELIVVYEKSGQQTKIADLDEFYNLLND